MHPIHVLLADDARVWRRYDPCAHALATLDGSEPAVTAAWGSAQELIDMNGALLIALVCEPGKAAAKYENPESLVWRDAGVVLGYMSIAAEALGLSFCPLGLLGNPLSTSTNEGAKPSLQGAGLAALSMRSRN